MSGWACSQQLSLQAPHESENQTEFCLGHSTGFPANPPPRQASSPVLWRQVRFRVWRLALAGSLDKPQLLSYTGRVSTVDRLPNNRLELLQGTLEVLILRSLKLESNHAYGISQFLQKQSDSEFLVDNGSLYPALQRLLQCEWISAQWKTSPNGRRARYYSLTPAGRKQLVKATSKWQRFALAMERIFAPEG